MARERPIKLHVKDGKDTTFRLIGPKGRVLNSLKWDGESLELSDVSVMDDVPEESISGVDESTPEPVGDENLQNILGDEPPASPAEAPDNEEVSTAEVGVMEGVEDVSGESEAALSEDDLADILDADIPKGDEETPDYEMSEDKPVKDESEPEAVEEKKKSE